MGLGFYMLHASIQVYVTELAPATRSSAVAFHTFSFFVGGGLSPIAYGIGIAELGPLITLTIAPADKVVISTDKSCSNCRLIAHSFNYLVYVVLPSEVRPPLGPLPPEGFKAEVSLRQSPAPLQRHWSFHCNLSPGLL